ncbi:glycoside hydrolase family 95-like protein [Paenibacillus arenilitoris]|uniref:glycoside hydrolase family 95-like protein n=1 Tax=Paenibacillus arenilitoris TaxID=2772299 RepID=UPI0037CCA7F6
MRGRLTEARIRSRLGGTCRCRTDCPIRIETNGTPVPFDLDSSGTFVFVTEKGCEYTIFPINAGRLVGMISR